MALPVELQANVASHLGRHWRTLTHILRSFMSTREQPKSWCEMPRVGIRDHFGGVIFGPIPHLALVAGVGFEPTCDRRMRPTSYRIALPRCELGSWAETRTRNTALSEQFDNQFQHPTIARLQFWQTSELCYTLTLGREVDLIT